MAQILIFEPDKHQRLLVGEELEEQGHTVRSASTPREALASVRQAPPDVVVLEVATAGVNGPQLIGRMLGGNPRLPVIVHTADARYLGDVASALVDACVIKRSDLRPLVAAVHRVLRRARLFSAPWRNASVSLASGSLQSGAEGPDREACVADAQVGSAGVHHHAVVVSAAEPVLQAGECGQLRAQ